MNNYKFFTLGLFGLLCVTSLSAMDNNRQPIFRNDFSQLAIPAACAVACTTLAVYTDNPYLKGGSMILAYVNGVRCSRVAVEDLDDLVQRYNLMQYVHKATKQSMQYASLAGLSGLAEK